MPVTPESTPPEKLITLIKLLKPTVNKILPAPLDKQVHKNVALAVKKAVKLN